ncbi:hypothetical protein QQS21_011977 [Conoideocrella luteorostrata]|uniref:Uncharacterized protein n=1 Tax=Conoideocrella luteorostrata TaxID=1105319 RepID=A0AAJ0CC33_9HYPO|nr:hypothetical protein QQS21_011977 [Conoideocrella luteorostrata]
MDSQKRYSRNRPSRGVGLRKTTGWYVATEPSKPMDPKHGHRDAIRCTRKKILCDYSHPSSTADAAWKLRRETTRVTRDRVNIGIDGRGDCGHGNGNGNTISDGRGKGNNDIAFDSNENGEIGNNGHGRSSNSDGDIEAIMDDVGNMVDGTGHICIDNQKDNNHSRHEAERTDDKLARHEDVSDESAKEERTAVGVMRISDKGERLDVHHTLETDVQLEDTLNMATGDDDVPQQQHEDEQMEFPTYNNELTHAASRQTRDDEPNFVDDNQACPKDQGPHNCTNAYNSVYENIPQDLVPPYRPSLPSGCSPDSHPMSGESHYSPTSRWLKLLISDTALDTALGEFTVIEQNGLDIFGNSLHQTPSSLVEGSSSSALPDHIIEAQETNQQFLSSSRKWLHPYLQERISPCCSPEKEKEEQRWKAKDPLVLRPQEQILFQHFIEHISQWV